jgi:hypothetical protein
MAPVVDAEHTRVIRGAAFALQTLYGPTEPGMVQASDPAGVPTGDGIEDLDPGVTSGACEPVHVPN